MKYRSALEKGWARFLSIIAIALVAASTAAAQANVPPPNQVVIHAGRLLDVKTGRWLSDQNIFVEGDKITRVEPSRPLGPNGWKVIDLGDAAVLPGLIDCHVHLTISPSSFGYELLGISEARQTLTGATNARKTLLAGFTTATSRLNSTGPVLSIFCRCSMPSASCTPMRI